MFHVLVVSLLTGVLGVVSCTEPVVTTQPTNTGPSKVKVVIYSDPQCHACYRLYTEIEPELIARYGGNPNFSMETRYVSIFGQDSSLAAQAMLCAAEQGKYDQFRGTILSAWDQQGVDAYSQSALESAGMVVGLNAAVFNSCLASGKYRQEIVDRVIEAGQKNIDQLPTIFVNEVRIIGVQPIDVFISAIDAELKK